MCTISRDPHCAQRGSGSSAAGRDAVQRRPLTGADRPGGVAVHAVEGGPPVSRPGLPQVDASTCPQCGQSSPGATGPPGDGAAGGGRPRSAFRVASSRLKPARHSAMSVSAIQPCAAMNAAAATLMPAHRAMSARKLRRRGRRRPGWVRGMVPLFRKGGLRVIRRRPPGDFSCSATGASSNGSRPPCAGHGRSGRRSQGMFRRPATGPRHHGRCRRGSNSRSPVQSLLPAVVSWRQMMTLERETDDHADCDEDEYAALCAQGNTASAEPVPEHLPPTSASSATVRLGRLAGGLDCLGEASSRAGDTSFARWAARR